MFHLVRPVSRPSSQYVHSQNQTIFYSAKIINRFGYFPACNKLNMHFSVLRVPGLRKKSAKIKDMVPPVLSGKPTASFVGMMQQSDRSPSTSKNFHQMPVSASSDSKTPFIVSITPITKRHLTDPDATFKATPPPPPLLTDTETRPADESGENLDISGVESLDSSANVFRAETNVSLLSSTPKLSNKTKATYTTSTPTGVPQPCEQCGAMFKSKSALRDHMYKHKEKYKCTLDDCHITLLLLLLNFSTTNADAMITSDCLQAGMRTQTECRLLLLLIKVNRF